MFRALRQFLHRPSVRMGPVDNRSLRRVTSTQNAQFVSYLAESGFRRVNPDRYERGMRRRKFATLALGGGLAALFAWIAIESARALSIF
jgi:hypothetical protein